MITLVMTLMEKGADGEFFLVKTTEVMDNIEDAKTFLFNKYQQLLRDLEKSEWRDEMHYTGIAPKVHKKLK